MHTKKQSLVETTKLSVLVDEYTVKGDIIEAVCFVPFAMSQECSILTIPTRLLEDYVEMHYEKGDVWVDEDEEGNRYYTTEMDAFNDERADEREAIIALLVDKYHGRKGCIHCEQPLFGRRDIQEMIADICRPVYTDGQLQTATHNMSLTPLS